MFRIYIKFYLSEPRVDRPSICVKPFISSSVPQLNNELELVSVLESARIRIRAFESCLSLILISKHDVSLSD